MSASPTVDSPTISHDLNSLCQREDQIAHTSAPTSAATMASAAVISPSTLTSTTSFNPTPTTASFEYSSYTTSSKRPKLSLNTGCSTTRTLGKGNTGLRLDTVTSIDPTLRNTYKNAYETSHSHHSIPHTPILKLDPEAPSPPHTPLPDGALVETPHEAPSSAESSPELKPVPYSRLHTLHSVLKNSPLPRQTPSRGTRKLFPPIKSVKFQELLTEEIETSIYVVKHSDLSSSSASSEDESEGPAPSTPPEQKPKTGTKRSSPSLREQSPRTDSNNEDDACQIPKTPVAGRAKKRREWTWTLDPVAPATATATASPQATAGSSEDAQTPAGLAPPVEDADLGKS